MTLGALIEMVGPVLSTVNVPLGPAAGAGLVAASVAVPAAILMPRVPLPVVPVMVTVRVVVPVPVTVTVPVAVPVGLFKVMFPVAKVTAVAPP